MDSRGPSGRITPDEFVERLKELVAANVAGSSQLVSRFSELVRAASEAASTSRGSERTDAETLLSRWLDFNLASYSVVSAQSLALLNGLISAAESTLIRTVPSATTAPRVELRLSGRHGERATTGFVIENNFDRPLAVTFEATELTPAAGPPLPASLVSFQPSTLVLDPRGQGVVQASITVTRDFEIGQTYTATIRLLGFEAKELGLSITILPAADPQGPSPVPPTPHKSRKRRRARAAK